MLDTLHPVTRLTEDYKARADELVLFVDESGDAQLNDPANRLFVLAACVVLGGTMDAVATEWESVRHSILGSRSAPLHFADHHVKRRIRRGTRANDLENFFNRAEIGRIGVSLTEPAGHNLSSGAGAMVIRAAFDELLSQHGRLIGTPIEGVVVFFENSVIMQRVYKLCSGLSLHRSDGFEVPVLFRWVTKNMNVPWMEIADGVAHTLAGDVRNVGLDPSFAGRMKAVFEPANRRPAIARKLVVHLKGSADAGTLMMKVTDQDGSFAGCIARA